MSDRASVKRAPAPGLLENVFEDFPDAVVITSASGEIVAANRQTETMFGYARAELLGLPVETLIPERRRPIDAGHPESYSPETQVLPTGIGLDRYGKRKDGSEFPVDTILSPLGMADGGGALRVVRDVTARWETEEALRQSEERLRLLVEAAKDYAIFMIDPNGLVRSWNPGAQRIKGYRAEEIIGKHFSQFYTPEDIEAGKPEQAIKTAAEQGAYEAEGWRVRKDGSRFWANVILTAVHGETGKLRGFARVTRDFSDRKRADDALQKSEQQFRALFEYSPDAILVIDPEGIIVEVNAQVEKFFGYHRTELAGQPVEILIPERFRGAHPRHRADYGAEPRARPMGIGLELCGRRKDGSEFPVDIMLSPVARPEGKNTISVIRDLSERRRAEDELERRERENRYLEEELNTEHRFEDIIGESTNLRKVLKEVETVAATNATVLILGETGTGKDLVARAIHQLSPRREHTLVKLNCAAIPVGLLESELFGHEKGAFTGAVSQKIGRLELAHRGTLFLDEVGDLPVELQPKLLRALQEKEFERLGGRARFPSMRGWWRQPTVIWNRWWRIASFAATCTTV